LQYPAPEVEKEFAIRLESGLVRPLTAPLNCIQQDISSAIDLIASEADKSAF